MPDPMMTMIIDQIKAEKCVLLLGPELLSAPGEPTAQEKLLHDLQAKGFAVEPDLDHFFNLKNVYGSKKVRFEAALKAYHEELPLDPLFEKLAAIPFHLFISLASDVRLIKIFTALNFAHDFQFYNKKVNPAEIPGTPTSHRPLLYNLFGSINEIQSLIYTYDDLFTFIFAILGERPLSISFQEQIQKAKLFLFLGFDFDKWYVKLLLRLLFQDHGNEPLPLTNHTSVADESTRAFYISNFQMEFIQNDVPTLIQTLYEQAGQEGILRKAQAEEPLPTIDKSQRLTDLNSEYNTLIEKLSRLRNAKTIETDTAVKFKQEKQIEAAEAELKTIETEIEALSIM